MPDHPKRRGFLAATASILALAPAAALAVPAPSAESHVVRLMRRLHALDCETLAVDKAGIASGADTHDEMCRLYDEIQTTSREVLVASPSSAKEATLILMLAIWEIEAGTAFEDNLEAVDRGNEAALRCCRWLAEHEGINLAEFGGDRFLPPVSS